MSDAVAAAAKFRLAARTADTPTAADASAANVASVAVSWRLLATAAAAAPAAVAPAAAAAAAAEIGSTTSKPLLPEWFATTLAPVNNSIEQQA
jgi:hypothetical protein